MLNDKAAQHDKTLYSGTVGNPRELQALQDEIGALKRRISQLEDQELELMEQIEPLDGELSRAATTRTALDERGTSLRAQIAEEEVAIDAELDAVHAERADDRRHGRPGPARRVRAAAPALRRHRHRPARRGPLRRVPPQPVGRRARPHQEAPARGARPLRGVRPPPRPLIRHLVLLWFVGPSILIVWSVFRSPSADYRVVAAGRSSPSSSSRSGSRACCTAWPARPWASPS